MDGPAGAPPLLLGPSVGTSTAVWDAVLPTLVDRFRVCRYDLPGHNGAPPLPAGATVDDIATSVLALADSLGWSTFHYAGVSIAGATGAVMALREPDRVLSLAMICSSARFGDPKTWRDRAATVRAEGTMSLVASTVGRWFANPDSPASPLGERLISDLVTVDPAGYAACCDALSTYDIRARLDEIDTPTLIIAGRQDPATPPAHARELADGIRPANLVEINGGGHLTVVDQPTAVSAALRHHLPGGHLPSDGTPDAGMRVRREVLGDDHVDRAVAKTTAFTADFQDLITRYAWGEIWTRPGLDRRTRSCVTLTALIAHGHFEELAMHVRAALRNGLTREEIGEVLLQSAIYCGVPAANRAFAVAQEVLG
nr:4-carboxymuconolactone decarboxylase [Actinokineospora inagensis]